MREIKFRIWCKEEKKWFEPIYEAYKGRLHDISISMGGQCAERTLEMCADIRRYQNFILSQFTGLTDKNGKEAYEGDILTNGVAKWEVIFNTGCFCAKLIDKKAAASEVHLALRGVKNFEIIGNIYENKNLLNL